MTRIAFQRRCLLISIVFVTLLSLLSVRLIKIQLWDRKHYQAKARRVIDSVETLVALRGRIVDRNDEVLAKSMPVSSVYVDISRLIDPDPSKGAADLGALGLAYDRVSRKEGWQNLDQDDRVKLIRKERTKILNDCEPSVIMEQALSRAVGILARPLGMTREEMRDRIVNNKSKYFPLVKDLPDDEAERLRTLIKENWIEGFQFEHSYRRFYASPDLACHVVGYTGEAEVLDENGKKQLKQIGKFGVESACDKYLTGRNGWQEHRRDPTGILMAGTAGSIQPPRQGLDVQLTLDMTIQAIAEEELDAGLKQFISKRGTAIVMDPKTGEVLAMVSRPGFNLEHLSNLDEAGMNFAIQGSYEPGSTIKIVATSGALNEKLVTPQTSIFCHNGYFQDGPVWVKDEHPQGTLTFEGVLQHSNNIGTYKMARQLGMTRFYSYMAKMGYGQKTGILLSGESSGRVKNTNNPMDFSRAAYGYATAVTPLQVATAYSVLAYDGKRRKPHIVKAITASDGTVVEQFGPEVVAEPLSLSTVKEMRHALIKVTEEGGTAKAAQVAGFKVAGKTGTAKRQQNGRYQEGHQTVSFVGMLPAEDPAFVCVVVVDDPLINKSIVAHVGGSIAGPIFSKIATRVAAHLNLTPTEPIDQKLVGNR
jgi:cell division protein FtsI/penicillin-binding protein 2